MTLITLNLWRLIFTTMWQHCRFRADLIIQGLYWSFPNNHFNDKGFLQITTPVLGGVWRARISSSLPANFSNPVESEWKICSLMHVISAVFILLWIAYESDVWNPELGDLREIKMVIIRCRTCQPEEIKNPMLVSLNNPSRERRNSSGGCTILLYSTWEL